MLKKILRINDFRVFKGWAGAPEAVDFGTVNIIYGVNGSGKSTLASLLAAAPRDDGWKTGLRVTVLDDHGNAATVSTPDHQVWQSIRVFNKEYVADNLRFDAGGDSGTRPLLILGKKHIDREDRVNAASGRLAQIADDLPATKAKRSKAVKARDGLATRTATQLVEELQGVGSRYAARSYDARKVKQGLAAHTDTSATYDVAVELEVARSSSLPAVALPARLSFDAAVSQGAVRDLLAQKATAQPIEVLRADHAKADWVQTGLTLHQSGDRCAFCAGVLTPERQVELERHFDESLRALQGDMRTVLGQLDRAGEALDEVARALPAAEGLHADIKEEWRAERSAVDAAIDELRLRLQSLRQLVEDKAPHLFTALDMPAELPGRGGVDLSQLAALLERHNKLSGDADGRRLEAARRVETQRIEAIREEYAELTEVIEDAAVLIGSLEAEQGALRSELRALAQDDMDAVPLANSLNEDLARLLGREDLSFSLSDEGYSIRRAGQPALYLSEGEKTAISLLYFLKSLDAHDCDRANAIVIIDDPVSSLDSNVVAGVSAHLWARLVGRGKCRQLFLLTHSFELFRGWGNQLDRLKPPVRAKENITDTMQELRVRMLKNLDGTVARQPFLHPWPSNFKDRNRIRSEYHYLFWRAASTLEACQNVPTLEAELDAAAILPNVCRRMLEGFLSFKYPGKIGDFRELVEEAIGDLDNSVTRTRLVAFLHQYSHNEEGDISKPISRPESVSILGAVFELIRYVDRDHYEKMCGALQVEPQLVGV
jgi:wobble nucleotide-excising tRNase